MKKRNAPDLTQPSSFILHPSSFTVRPCTPADVAHLAAYVPNWPRAEDATPQVRDGWAFVGELAGQLVVGAGLDPLMPTDPTWRVAQAWLVVVPGACSWCPRSVARSLKQGLAWLIAQHRLWRVEAHVHVELPQAIRLAEWLGFRREGTKVAWGPDGKDYHHYARIEERFLPWFRS